MGAQDVRDAFLRCTTWPVVCIANMPRTQASSHISNLVGEAPYGSEVPFVSEAPSFCETAVGHTVDTTHVTDTLSRLSPNRSFKFDESALALRNIDFDSEGHLSEFLEIAEADKNW